MCSSDLVLPTNWRMRVVGPDEAGHLEDIQAAVSKNGLSNTWSFEPALDDGSKWQAYAEADLDRQSVV